MHIACRLLAILEVVIGGSRNAYQGRAISTAVAAVYRGSGD